MSFVDLLFGCRHREYTWPRKRKDGTFVICTCCGAELPYSEVHMRKLTAKELMFGGAK